MRVKFEGDGSATDCCWRKKMENASTADVHVGVVCSSATAGCAVIIPGHEDALAANFRGFVICRVSAGLG